MARNYSEKVEPAEGMSGELFEFLHNEALVGNPSSLSHAAGLLAEYLEMSYAARCRFRALLRKASGRPIHLEGLYNNRPDDAARTTDGT